MIINYKNLQNYMNPTVYLRTGDLITISYQNLYLAIQSLTQSVPTMKQSISNSLNAVFLLTTQKCLQKSLAQQKPLISYNEDDIYYSEPVLLYHLLSGRFLSYSKDIENKASVQLITSFKQNCKFSIKAIFKCQTVITRKIRNQESVIISPAQAYNHQGNIALVALRNDSRKGDQSYILMKKNENSKFILARKNQHSLPQTSLSNIYVYQLLNIETKKNLYMQQDQIKHKDMVTFEKKINEIGSYFDIRLKHTQYNTINVKQQQIKYGIPFYIHSWKQNKYLSINIIGDACLTQIPNEQAQFILQSYSDLQLNRDSVVRIKHLSSQKYLSLNTQASQVQTTNQVRLIDTCMIVKMTIQQLRLNVFINNAHDIIQKQLSGKKISYNNRENIFKVLKELINFIYGDQITISDYLSMKNKISCKLSSNDQKLLANIGIINTLVRMCRTFIQQINFQKDKKEFQQKDNTDEQVIIIYTMMSIVGICNRNAASTRILVQQMPLLYQSLVSVSGIIQSFYNLFKDSKQLLLILENTSHKIGRREVPSMEVLMNMLAGHTLDIPTKCKILKLLEVFIIVNHKQKILGHQAILFKFLLQNKLENILLPMKSNDHQDLFIYIPQKKKYEQLQQVLSTRKTHEKQLQLVKTQLQLICSLCLNSHYQCFNYAKKIISQQMLYRYLKGNLPPDFKQIFMRFLIDVYLSNLAARNNSLAKSFIICKDDYAENKSRQYSKMEQSSVRDNLLNEDGYQMSNISQPSHSKIIQNIQNYILDVTKKSITNQIIDSSFYMNLKSLRKFLDLHILDKDQVVQFRFLLIQYITKFLKASFKEQEKKKIVLQIIKIMTDYLNQLIQAISQDFIIMLKTQKIAEKQLFPSFLLFIKQKQFFNSQLQEQQLLFLPRLIKQSIQFNSPQIFMAASRFFKLVNERISVLISRLKDKIIIESDWSFKFFNKIQNLKRSLSKQIQAYMSSKSDQKQIQYVEQQLNQVIKQLNFCFYQNPTQSHSFSQLTQNIYRQMNLLEIIISFLNESQDKFKQASKSNLNIYSTCFQFIGMYLQDNRQNFSRFQEKYLDIKFVFEHSDRGQIKFLNHLIKMPNARDLMMDQIIQCTLLSFEHNTDPNPYTLLVLLNSISNPHIDKQRIQILVQKLIKMPKMFKSILKVQQYKTSYNFIWSFNPKNKNYHSQWLLYSYLMIKLLLILCQQSVQRTTLALQIQKYISISSLMQLLTAQDLLTNTSLLCLEGSLLKSQVIKLFTKTYLTLLQKQQHQIQNISTFVHVTLRCLGFVKQDNQRLNNQLSQQIYLRTSDHGNIIFQSQIKSKTKLTVIQFQKYLNPVYISIVQNIPFCIKLLDKLVNSNPYIQNNQTKKTQINLYLQDIYRKLRDFIQYKLTYKQFNRFNKQYQSAIVNSEDLLKKKLGWNMQIQQDEQQQQDIGDIQTQQYFINTKIQNTIKCYKSVIGTHEKDIYSAFIYIFHSQQFTKYLRQEQQKFRITFTSLQMQKIMILMSKYINQNQQYLSQALHLFYFFCMFNKQHCLKMMFGGIRQELMVYLSNEKQDVGNQKLCSYLAIASRLFKLEVEKQVNVQKKGQVTFPFKDSFINRICRRIQAQKILYSVHKFNQQAVIYSQNKLLSYQSIQQNLTIQLILQWIRNLAIITPFGIKQKYYYKIFMDIVDLLKIYNLFIKEFNSKYITYEIYNKINICLSIIFHFISGLTTKSVLTNYLIQRQIWNDFNTILGLDDGWVKNLDQFQDNQNQIFNKVIKYQARTTSKIFLKQAEKYYLNSKQCYKQLIPNTYFPLLPMKALFGQAKSNAISILKQFKNFPIQIQKQLYSRIEIPIINKNIFEIYTKHQKLFNQYSIPSVQVNINFDNKNQWKAVAENIVFQNGTDLTSLKMHIGSISGNYQIKTQYNNLRLQALTSKKIQSAFSSLWTFIKQFFLLFISCFLAMCKKNKKNSYKNLQIQINQQKMAAIYAFFLTKIGRVQIISQNQTQLLSKDFLIRPQCTLNKLTKQKFIESINFISMQLKLQSIHNQACRFLLQFQNQIDFYRRFNKISYLTFLTKNVDMLIILNFAVIVAQNLILLLNSDSNSQYFTTNQLSQPFVWIQIANMVIAASVMIAYLVKDFNLLLKNINRILKIRSESYGSNFNNYHPIIKLGIKLSKIVLDPTFEYHLIYTLIVCLVFYNKLFAAILLLDLFFQISTLKNLLMSVWKPKIQLILALFSFVLLQYFFSIFMFFNFKSQTLGNCQTLGSCFGFVFVTTYKAIGGFVGYLFIKNGSQIPPVNFFQIFQDIYVVLIYQIFFALILAIIIDTFSSIRSEQATRKDYLNGCCIVCNLDKTKFNSSTMSFKAHIALTHNIWNYFYYYQYIFHKPAVKRTSYQRQIYLSRSASWLPIDVSFDVVDDKIGIEKDKEERMIKN